MIVCKSCLEKDNAVASPDADAWNNRGPAEITKRDLVHLRIALERWIDDVSDDIEMSNFKWKDKIKKKEELESLSNKIRLWSGR